MTDHVDMSQFIAARSDQMNADDLLDAPRTITITKVTASPDAAEQPVSVHYEGDEGKPFKPCKTVRRIMVGVWGKDASKYVGRSMTLFRDAAVSFGGMQVGGIRVSHMSHMDGKKTVALQVTRGRKAPYTVLPLETPAPSAAAEDGATKWANAYIGKLAGFTTLDAVQTFADEKAAKLAELQTARPELYAKVMAALSARKEAINAESSFDDDDLADDAEPKPGNLLDQIEGDAAQKIKDDLETAAVDGNTQAVERIIAAAEQRRGEFTDDQLLVLETAYSKARQKVGARESADG